MLFDWLLPKEDAPLLTPTQRREQYNKVTDAAGGQITNAIFARLCAVARVFVVSRMRRVGAGKGIAGARHLCGHTRYN